MAKKSKVPKRLAGVKLPKALRRALKDLSRSQSGRTVLGEALLAAGGALAAYEARPGSRTRGLIAAKAPKVKAKAKAVALEARSWKGAGGAFEDAARAFTEALRGRDSADQPPRAQSNASQTPAPTP